MIIDKLTRFCDKTAMNTGAAGSYLIGDVIDLEDARDIGQGYPLYLVINVATTATGGAGATAQFKLVSDAKPLSLRAVQRSILRLPPRPWPI